MINRRFEVIHISDVHYGSRSVEPASITAGLMRALDIEDTSLQHVDLLVIDGDFFDSDFRLADDASAGAMLGIAHILRVCDRYNIPLDVLEGTPKHDRNQSRHFKTQLEALQLNVDLRWFTEITVRHLESHGLDILYVPDGMGPSAQVIYEHCVELLRTRGLTHVDFAHMHCAWQYQMPIAHPSYHDSAEWAAIVRYNIFSGHIHGHSQYLKNVSVGSFGRNFHGEEEPKGYLRCVYEPGKDPIIRQIVNPCARVFKTFDIEGLEQQDIEAMIRAANLHDFAAVRLLHNANPAIKTVVDLLRVQFPTFSFKEQKHKDVKPEQTHDILGEAEVIDTTEFVSLSPQNMLLLTEERLRSGEVDLRGQSVNDLVATLREVLDE